MQDSSMMMEVLMMMGELVDPLREVLSVGSTLWKWRGGKGERGRRERERVPLLPHFVPPTNLCVVGLWLIKL